MAKKLNHGETRTHNPQIRSLMRYPLRHAANWVPLMVILLIAIIFTMLGFAPSRSDCLLSSNERDWSLASRVKIVHSRITSQYNYLQGSPHYYFIAND
jgi:hypothetical protein